MKGRQVSFMADADLVAELGARAEAAGHSIAQEIRSIIDRFLHSNCVICGYPAIGEYCSSCDWMLGRAAAEWEKAA